MTILQAVLLGVLQGLTEFLPVSSSGHLALAEHFFHVTSPGVTFEVLLHLGTALAVVVWFRRRIASILVALARAAARLPHDRDAARLGVHLIVGTIPAAVVGYLLEKEVERAFESPAVVSALLLVTGLFLWAAGRARPGRRERTTLADALWIGVAQAVAVLPGISRSGATISAGLGRGLRREAAVEFAFFLSVPVILGAAAASLPDARAAGGDIGWPVALGSAVAFASALPAIAVLVRAVAGGRIQRFAYYCWAVGGAGLVLSAVRG
jgi:undecaprenyl-diphosphatase